MNYHNRLYHHYFTCLATLIIFVSGCVSPEMKAQKESRRTEASEKKALAEQDNWRRLLAPYTDEQLEARIQGLNDAVQRGQQGLNILLAQGNGAGSMVAIGQIEKKVKERDAIALELARRRSEPAQQTTPTPIDTTIINEDDRKFFELIKDKAITGDAEAQWNLGYYYAIGKGILKNETEAEKWYLKSAEQGNALAQGSLGTIYFDGVGVKKDYNKAFKWFQKAAEQGVDYAQLCLGIIYAKGLGGEKPNWVEAAKWMRRAAEQGLGNAQGALGECYQNGEGVPQDYVEAYKWFNLSAAQGDLLSPKGISVQERNSITRLMTPEQIAEGQRRAAAFVPLKEK